MAFFSNIKRAFGFNSADDYDDVEGIDATVYPLSQHRNDVEVTIETSTGSCKETLAEDSACPQENSDLDDCIVMRKRIFETVVSTFNESLPEFIKSSVDAEAQQKYLYDALDDSVKKYFDQIDERARRLTRSTWEKERQRIDAENKANSEKIKELEVRNEEGKKQQLSAERQKRALAERIHDLEGRVATLEAEKEQYELENKSLLNKLRVSAVQADGVSTSECDMVDGERLQQELSDLKDKYASAVAELAQLQAKTDIADTMINELNAKASEAQKKQIVAETTLKAIAEERDAATTRIVQLQEDLSNSDKELQAARVEISEAKEAVKAIDEIQEQLSRFEDVKEAKDRRISELSTENNRLMMIVDSLKSEVSSLKKTIESNLFSQAESESALRREIEELKRSVPQQPVSSLEELPPEPIKPTKRKRKPKISAIDESIDDTDWLVAAPIKPSKSIVAESEAPFGYQAPVKKQHPENDAQMSLW